MFQDLKFHVVRRPCALRPVKDHRDCGLVRKSRRAKSIVGRQEARARRGCSIVQTALELRAGKTSGWFLCAARRS